MGLGSEVGIQEWEWELEYGNRTVNIEMEMQNLQQDREYENGKRAWDIGLGIWDLQPQRIWDREREGDWDGSRMGSGVG